MNIDISYYIKKLKYHEAHRTSTNERNAFWRLYNENN